MSNELQTKLIVTAEDRGASTLLKRMGIEADMFVDKFSQIGSALTTALGGFTAGYAVKKALQWVDDYRKSVLSVAVTLTDTVVGDSKKIQAAFDQNMKHADRFFRLLQAQSTRSLSTVSDLLNAYTMFTAKGVALSPTIQNAKRLADLTDRILLATRGQNSTMQVFQELRAIMNGAALPSAATMQIFRQRDPRYVEHLREIYAGGGKDVGDRLMNYLETLLSDLDLKQVMDKTLSYSFKRLQGNIQIWAQQALVPLYDELTGIVKRLADFFGKDNSFKKSMQEFVDKMREIVQWGERMFTRFQDYLNSNSEMAKTLQGIINALPKIVELLMAAKAAAMGLGFAHAAIAGTLAAAYTIPGAALIASGGFQAAKLYATTNSGRPYENYGAGDTINVAPGDAEFKYGLRMVIAIIEANLPRIGELILNFMELVRDIVLSTYHEIMVYYKTIEFLVRKLIDQLPGWLKKEDTRRVDAVDKDIESALAKRYKNVRYEREFVPGQGNMNGSYRTLQPKYFDDFYATIMNIVRSNASFRDKLTAIRREETNYLAKRESRKKYGQYGDTNELNGQYDTLEMYLRERETARPSLPSIGEWLGKYLANAKDASIKKFSTLGNVFSSAKNIVTNMANPLDDAVAMSILERISTSATDTNGKPLYTSEEAVRQFNENRKKVKQAVIDSALAVTGPKNPPETTSGPASPVPYWQSAMRSVSISSQAKDELARQIQIFEVRQKIHDLYLETTGVEEDTKQKEERIKDLQMQAAEARRVALEMAIEENRYLEEQRKLREDGGLAAAGKSWVMEQARSAKSTFDMYVEMVDRAGKQMQTTLSDALYSVFTGDFDNLTDLFRNFVNGLLKAWTDMVSQMIMQWMMVKLAMGLGAGAVNSAVGGAASAASSVPASYSANWSNVPLYSGAVGGISIGGSANGNVLRGGFHPFAGGGIVTAPTLGLVGEGRYNEAIVPLPDGRSIPVEMRGGSNVTVNINDNSGNGNRYRTEQREDEDGNLIIDVIVDAMLRNRKGFRKNMQAMLAQPKGAM